MKSKLLFEPHLVINEIRLPKGGEWMPHFRGWCVSYIGSGISYWQEQGEACEVAAGSILLLSSEAGGKLRASQLSEVAITYFCVEIEKLHALLSLREQHFFTQAAGRKSQAVRMLSPDSPMSDRCKEPFCQSRRRQRFFDAAAPAAIFHGPVRIRYRPRRGSALCLDGWAGAVPQDC